MKVYFISGLGADERVFRSLNLPDIEKVFIQWEIPLQGESLREYCKRLIPQINSKDEVILTGLSFGGIVAQEIAKMIDCKKVIIISSVKSHTEMGWHFALVKRSGLFHLFPIHKLKVMNKFVAGYVFSTAKKGESLLLKQILHDTSVEFLEWAALQILKWESTTIPDNLLHIHGTKDRIFRYHNIKGCIPIKDGGHFMVLSKAEEVSLRIMEILNHRS